MSNIIQPYHSVKKLSNLSGQLPLRTPFTLKIETSAICNFRCQFCPVGHPGLFRKSERKMGLMEKKLFEKIINDAKAFPDKLKQVTLYFMGESLLHPQLPEFVAYVKKMDITELSIISTNASQLTPKKALQLMDAGLDWLRVSVVHVNEEGYHTVANTFDNYEQILKNVRMARKIRDDGHYQTKISCKIIDDYLSEEEKKKFLADFSEFANEIYFMSIQGMSGGGGVDFQMGYKPITAYDGKSPYRPNRIVCSYPFYHLTVGVDGRVVSCVADWALKNIIGNAWKESLVEIWNSKALLMFQRLQLSGKRFDNANCKDCKFIGSISLESDLDDVMERSK